MRHEHGLSGPVEHGAHFDFRGIHGNGGVQVDDDGGAGVQLHVAEAPGQALAKEKIVAVMQEGRG
ncbi:hypothetical protein D3C83_332300 [compost metagenome]